MDTSSPVADGYFEQAPFAFDGTIERLHFKNLSDRKQETTGVPDDGRA